MRLFNYYRSLYGGYRLQNHALNSRVNDKFHNKIKNVVNDLIIVNTGKHLIRIGYIYIEGHDINLVSCKINKQFDGKRPFPNKHLGRTERSDRPF